MPMCPNCGVSDPEVYLGFTSIECVNRECVSYHSTQSTSGSFSALEKVIEFCEHFITHNTQHPRYSARISDKGEMELWGYGKNIDYELETVIDKDTLQRLEQKYTRLRGRAVNWLNMEECLDFLRIYQKELQQQEEAA